MTRTLLILFFGLLATKSLSQFAGKTVTIESDGFCGSYISFESDSLAWYFAGCEGTQRFVKLNFRVSTNGELEFSMVPESLYQPLLGLTKGTVHFQSYDSLFNLPQLVFMNNGRAYTESLWKLSGDTVARQSGSLFSTISNRFFADTTLKIRFPELDNLKDSLPEIVYTDFVGEGEYFIVNTDLPPGFFIYTDLSYSTNYCKVSKLKFKLVKNQLYFFDGKKWQLIKDEK